MLCDHTVLPVRKLHHQKKTHPLQIPYPHRIAIGDGRPPPSPILAVALIILATYNQALNAAKEAEEHSNQAGTTSKFSTSWVHRFRTPISAARLARSNQKTDINVCLTLFFRLVRFDLVFRSFYFHCRDWSAFSSIIYIGIRGLVLLESAICPQLDHIYANNWAF